MKLLAYEVRPDEEPYFQKLAQGHGVEITRMAAVPLPGNAHFTRGVDGVSVLGQGKINRELLELWKTNGVRAVSTRTVGYNHIDLAAARELGIAVCHADYPPTGVADYTVMLLLLCLRHYKQALWRGQVNDFSLNGLCGREVNRLTVGIVGGGRIGKAVAQNLSGFGCRLLVYSRHEDAELRRLAEYVDLETLYRTCDVVSLHLPLTPETYHLINRDSIAKMKDGVVILNCARGELADLSALIEGIETEKIGALGLDVVEGEEGITHVDHRIDIIANRNMAYLKQFRNVVMTQHMAFYTDVAVESMVRCGVEGLLQMLAGDPCKTQL